MTRKYYNDTDLPWYYSNFGSLYRHVVCNVPISCKANGERSQLEAWLDSDLINQFLILRGRTSLHDKPTERLHKQEHTM